jgi:hypothetical protein
MRELYFMFCNWVGYIIIYTHHYSEHAIVRNSHIALMKYVSKRDIHGCRKLKQIFQIQVKKL